MIAPAVRAAARRGTGAPPGEARLKIVVEVAMRSDRVISTIDFHTAGIGMRLLTSGLGRLPGATIGAKRRFFQEHHDDLRTGLCLWPRGHRSLLIAVMTEAVTPGAHFGLFFMYPGGYYVSCGEGTIGAATVAIETGMVQRLGAETPVVIDTEAGVVETIARSDRDRVREVTLRWAPSFVVLTGQSVEVESLGATSPAGSPVRPRSKAGARSCRRSPGPRTSPASASFSSIRKTRCAPGISSRGDRVKTLVLGGGVVGVTTAYFLAKAGHEVTLVDEKDGVGLEASAGNAGIIAPGHSFAWASPRAPRMLWESLRGAETAIRIRPTTDLRLYTWGLRFLRECTADRAKRNTLVKLRLCQYSQAVMNELVRAEQIEYHAIAKGALYLYRDGAELDAGVKKMALLAEHGQKQEILDARGVAQLDPVFEPVQGKIAGAIRDVGDSSGDSRLFVENLARVCREKLGVVVRLGTRVTELRGDADRIDMALTSAGGLKADNYVLALGVGAPSIARTVGVGLPVYPAKGYSSTFPLKPGGRSPTVPGVDEKWLVGWSRLGDRLRLTSTAEFAGYDWGWTPRDFNNILKLARDLFPDAADYDRGEYRACLRPMTPDGPPILGLGRHRNLFLNCGHGHMGWTMACVTARLVADFMTGRMPELDLEGLTPRR